MKLNQNVISESDKLLISLFGTEEERAAGNLHDAHIDKEYDKECKDLRDSMQLSTDSSSEEEYDGLSGFYNHRAPVEEVVSIYSNTDSSDDSLKSLEDHMEFLLQNIIDKASSVGCGQGFNQFVFRIDHNGHKIYSDWTGLQHAV